jgi:hypothetical protein
LLFGGFRKPKHTQGPRSQGQGFKESVLPSRSPQAYRGSNCFAFKLQPCSWVSHNLQHHDNCLSALLISLVRHVSHQDRKIVSQTTRARTFATPRRGRREKEKMKEKKKKKRKKKEKKRKEEKANTTSPMAECYCDCSLSILLHANYKKWSDCENDDTL